MSLSAFVSDALRKRLRRVTLPTFAGTGRKPGVDLDNSAALLDLMDDGWRTR